MGDLGGVQAVAKFHQVERHRPAQVEQVGEFAGVFGGEQPALVFRLGHEGGVQLAVAVDVWEGQNPVGKVRALKFDETEMAYLEAEQIWPLLADLDGRDIATGIVARICLATGARWSEAEGLTSRQVRGGRIHFARTKSSKNRTVPISEDLQTQIKAALPFGDCYKKFEASVDAVKLDLPAGQLTHVLRHTFASHYMMNGGDILTLQRVLGHASLAMTMKYAHFSPGHLAEVVTLNPLSKIEAAG